MKALFRKAKMFENGKMTEQDMLFDGNSLSVFEGDVSVFDSSLIFDNTAILPGFCDVHVHLREPGFSYKETIATGTLASARGGYTAVCSMPNLKPTPDSRENLDIQLDIIRRDAKIKVIPYGTITCGELGEQLSDMEEMAADVVGFSDDGRGVQTDGMMLEAMKKAKAMNKPIVAHCEVNSLLRGGYIHDGEYARTHGHKGICSESEWGQIKRDLELVRKTGVKYHVCHISTKESLELIREAKREGLDVSCETGPHYLLLDDSRLLEHGRFKMNPPLRSPEDREAMVAGLIDGTVDMIATDHAPHSAEEKSKGLSGSLMGVVGIETAFPLMYTNFVKSGLMTLPRLVELMSENPRHRFSIDSDTGFTVFDLDASYCINPESFLSMGKSTPFEGERVFGECLLTVYEGKAVYTSERLPKN